MSKQDDHNPSARTSARRRRVLAVAAAAGVAAAIAVPAFLLGGDGPDPEAAGPPAPPASATDSTTASPGPTGPIGIPPPGEPYDLREDIVEGAPLRVPYLERAELVRPDGTTVQLPQAYDQFVPFGDGIAGIYNDRLGDRFVDFLDASGERVDSGSAYTDVVGNAAGDLVAWTTPQGELETAWPGGRLSWGNQGGPVSVADVLGDPPCVAGKPGCRVFVNNVDGRPPSIAAPDGSVEQVSPSAMRVQDAHQSGLATVVLSVRDMGSCSGVYDFDRERLLWQTCDRLLMRFSPDATYVLATDPFLDDVGLASVSVLEVATGTVVAEFRIVGGFISQAAWEDDEHPLLVVCGDGWEILRLGLDGARERAVGPVPLAQDPTSRRLVIPGNA